MNPLGFDNQLWPLARIVTAPAFALGAGPWTVQPMWNKRRNGFGFELLSCQRVALPAIGEATFQYRFGFIDGMQVGVKTAAGVARRIAGSAWDPAQDSATAPDLSGYEVRIQLADPVEQGTTPAWQTVWWGQVEYQEDSVWPGATYPAGVRTYRCIDGFARAKRWPLNRHSTYGNGTFFIDCEGHPGYNVGLDGRIVGNRDTNALGSAGDLSFNQALAELVSQSDTKYKLHCIQGIAGALTFTVKEALEDAVRKTRGYGEPIFNFYGDTDLIGDAIALPVREGDTAWDLVARTCRRERGRGLVFVDWADDSATPAGAFSPRLTIRPQTLDDITYTAPAAGGSPTPLVGAASTAGGRTATTVTVDVIGDHRLVADETKIADKFLHVADAVETTSELIQVLVTLSYFDGTDYSLSKRWTTARESTFAALAAKKRIDEAWEPMWQLHGLPDGWDGRAKDHNGGTGYYCDFSMSDAGALTPSTSTRAITSPILCRIMPDLPILEGYDYSVNPPVRKTGDQVSLDETGRPARARPLILIRTASNRYQTGDTCANGARALTYHPRGRDLLIYCGEDKKKGLRVVGNTATAGLGSQYNLAALGVTVGIELPHRVRMKTVRDGVTQVKRIVPIRIPDLHVWLAHSGAVWDIDASSKNADGYQGRRSAAGASGATPGKIRDDRDALARIHAMACAWYLASRQTAKWTLRACGLLPSFETQGANPGDSAETVTYPTIGSVVTDFKSSGQITSLNTPVTMVYYNHQDGRTTWETDWQELDFQ